MGCNFEVSGSWQKRTGLPLGAGLQLLQKDEGMVIFQLKSSPTGVPDVHDVEVTDIVVTPTS